MNDAPSPQGLFAKMTKITKMLTILLTTGVLLNYANAAEKKAAVLTTNALKSHVEQFNADDDELYINSVPNKEALGFLEANIPLFDCPDEDFERTWYFRWWTYRKHVKKTPDGYVITEFLPKVGWSRKHNTISCPAGHHYYEGRWLHNTKLLDDYSVFWLRKGGSPRNYSFWIADAYYARHLVTPNKELLVDLLDDLIKNYAEWEKSRRGKEMMFFQSDDRDGMEMSIGGSGFRATINSYMYGDAKAIVQIAKLAGREDVAKEFEAKAEEIKELVQTKLWDKEAQFFKVLRRGSKELEKVREQHGYTPWYFNLPDKNRGYEAAWKQLMDPQGFYAPYGPTSAEQRHPNFKISYQGHECQWNGPSWPFATSQTLTALANVLNNYDQEAVTKKDYFDTLKIYTECHLLRAVAPPAAPSLNSSSDQRSRRHTWWSKETLGSEQWVQYSFPKAVAVDAVQVFWFDDNAGCDLPASWRLEYKVGDQWNAVKAQYPVAGDQFCKATFQPVTGKEFRLVVQAKQEKSAGILEWQMLSETKNLAGQAKASASYTDKYAGTTAALNDGAEDDAEEKKVAPKKQVPWIDENINPNTGDWISRTRLKDWNWRPSKGGKERGKDYNHSTYNDLIITGLVGLRPRADNVVEVNPLLPDGTWDYFCLDNLLYHGRILTILWDKTGKKYGKGKGLIVLAEGKEIAKSPTLSRVTGELK